MISTDLKFEETADSIIFALLEKEETYLKEKEQNIEISPLIEGLCINCPQSLYAEYGISAASRHRGGPKPQVKKFLIASSLFETEFHLLSKRLDKKLWKVKEMTKGHLFASFRVYNLVVQNNGEILNESFATQDSLEEENCLKPGSFKIKIENQNEHQTYQFIKVSDHIRLDELKDDHRWIQSHLFFCPKCKNYYGLDKKGAVSKETCLGDSLALVKPHEPLKIETWTLRDILEILELNVSYNFEEYNSGLWKKLVKKAKDIWDNSFEDKNDLANKSQEWFAHFFNRDQNTFLSITRNFIRLNLTFDPESLNLYFDEVKDEIGKKLDIVQRLKLVMEKSKFLQTSSFRLPLFLMCLIGKPPKNLEDNEKLNFEKIAYFFFPKNKAEDIVDILYEGRDTDLEQVSNDLFNFKPSVWHAGDVINPNHQPVNQENEVEVGCDDSIEGGEEDSYEVDDDESEN